jgi:hypothetical protein
MERRRITHSITRSALFFIIILLVWSSFPSTTQAAAVVFVRPDGDDWQCNGLVDDPYPGGTGPLPCAVQTFGRAHQIVDDPGIIYVGAGVYSDVFSIGKSVTVVGAGVDQTIIDREGSPQGINVDNPVTPTVIISDLTVRNGVSAGPGGGVAVWNANVTMRDCAIQNNTALSGGGIENWGNLTLERCTIDGNTATGNFGGGGIYNLGTLTLIDSSVVNNHADNIGASGGGILNDNNDPGEYVHLIRTTLSGNSADSYGSAYKDQGDGPVWLANVTVFGNTIASGDGTLMITAGKTIDIWNSTIAGNHAGGPGVEGGIMTESPVILANTILADNDNSNCYVTGAGAITTTGSNIDSGTSCGFGGGGNMFNTDPLLGLLADNGGYTETMALLPGSPAIDTGNGTVCSWTHVDDVDQRGVARPIGAGCDIGAYEAPIWLFLPLILR